MEGGGSGQSRGIDTMTLHFRGLILCHVAVGDEHDAEANAAAPLAALQPLVFGDVAMCSSAARKYAPLAASCACISAALALCMPSFRSGYFTKSADSAAAAAYPDVLCTAFLTLIFSVALWRSSYTFIARLLRGFVAASMRL